MAKDDWLAIWQTLDFAGNHLLVARFGRHSAKAVANLYRRAAHLLLQVAERLLEIADMEDEMRDAERMVQREKWPAR